MAVTRLAPSSSTAALAGGEGLQYAKLRPGPGQAASDVEAHQRERVYNAMVEVVAEYGYDAVTVRELVRVAGISSRTFYKLFASKDECFQLTYDRIVRSMGARMVFSQVGNGSPRRRLRVAVETLVEEVAREPSAARLVFVEAYSAGPEMLPRTRRTEGAVAEGLARLTEGVVPDSLALEGLVTGLFGVVRVSLARRDPEHLRQLGQAFMNWLDVALRQQDAAAFRAPGTPARGNRSVESVSPSNVSTAEGAGGERALLISAAAKLLKEERVDDLTVAKVLAMAGLRRGAFDAYFGDARDCLLALLESRTQAAINRALAISGKESALFGRLHLATRALCEEIEADFLIRQVLADRPSLQRDLSMIPLLTRFLENIAAESILPDDVATETSAAVLWGVIQQHAHSPQSLSPSQCSAVLASFACVCMVTPEDQSPVQREVGAVRKQSAPFFDMTALSMGVCARSINSTNQP